MGWATFVVATAGLATGCVTDLLHRKRLGGFDRLVLGTVFGQ